MNDRASLSPCIAVCRLNTAGTHCLGCGRTLDEIAGWSGLDQRARAAVMERLPARLNALGTERAID